MALPSPSACCLAVFARLGAGGVARQKQISVYCTTVNLLPYRPSTLKTHRNYFAAASRTTGGPRLPFGAPVLPTPLAAPLHAVRSASLRRFGVRGKHTGDAPPPPASEPSPTSRSNRGSRPSKSVDDAGKKTQPARPQSSPSWFASATAQFRDSILRARLPTSEELAEVALVLRDSGTFLSVFLARLIAAVGIYHVTFEYGFEFVSCEGPSMMPTIRHEGEIVLMEKFSHRLLGVDGGDDGEERARRARVRQLEWEVQNRAEGRVRSTDDKREEYDDDKDEDEDSTVSKWHEPLLAPAHLPPRDSWSNLRTRLTTGITRGDIVILENPRREGTVCKRVLGLPGDMVVTVPEGTAGRNLTAAAGRRRAEMLFESWEEGQARRRRQRRHKEGKRSPELSSIKQSSSLQVIPDGHLWLEGDNSPFSRDSREYGSVPAALVRGRIVCRVWPLRGGALMGRGATPPPREGAPFSGSVALPAGYGGQRIVTKIGR